MHAIPDPPRHRQAAKLNDAKALLQMGVCYISGRGVAVSEEAAFVVFERAAGLGDATAQYNAGVCLGKGRGVAPDPVRAAQVCLRDPSPSANIYSNIHLSVQHSLLQQISINI